MAHEDIAMTAHAAEPERLDLRSLDITAEQRQELLRLFPEIRTEGAKIDLGKVKMIYIDPPYNTGNDQLKANAVQIFKTKGVTSFKTV